jgi:hypothetical protein
VVRAEGSDSNTTRTSDGRELLSSSPAPSGPLRARAGSDRVPTITGWTNSTAICRAWSFQSGARHHKVAPRSNRRANSSAQRASTSGSTGAPAGRPSSIGLGRYRVVVPRYYPAPAQPFTTGRSVIGSDAGPRAF